jgi:hypothetical protein
MLVALLRLVSFDVRSFAHALPYSKRWLASWAASVSRRFQTTAVCTPAPVNHPEQLAHSTNNHDNDLH